MVDNDDIAGEAGRWEEIHKLSHEVIEVLQKTGDKVKPAYEKLIKCARALEESPDQDEESRVLARTARLLAGELMAANDILRTVSGKVHDPEFWGYRVEGGPQPGDIVVVGVLSPGGMPHPMGTPTPRKNDA